MKLSRITAVVTAASIAPAVFLATPAVADVQPPVTAGSEEKPGPAGGEKSSAEEETRVTRTVEVPNFPEKLTAGGDWTEFSFVLDNKDAEELKDFSLSFWLNGIGKSTGKLDPKDPRATKLIYRTRSGSAASDWKSMVDVVTNVTVEGKRKFGKIPKGEKLTVDLRIRLGDAFPAGQASPIVNTPAGVEAPSLRDITVVAKGGGKSDPTDPKPTASATTGGGTKTKEPKTGPSPKASATATPTTSATATATATPSASATTAAAVAGNTTTTNSGSSELAKTGAGSSTPWAVAGSAAALALGTGLVVMARRRGAAQG
ncbi:LAETG motif-containing sortase-dependent surface protein [Streptomyces netropsis]|uniref:LAETG motif-containing sortase-dependent surface protein n=1 Tax=Streptomyces netropsis TaxID=55404 RepID=UPI0030CB801B